MRVERYAEKEPRPESNIRLATVKRGKLRDRHDSTMKDMRTFLSSFSREALISSNEAILWVRT